MDWERLQLLLHKVERRLREKGVVQTRLPPPKVVIPLLEHATMEYEDDLLTLWANLLASAMDPKEEQAQKKYVSTLAEMTGEDAKTLKDLSDAWERRDKSQKWYHNGPVRYEPGIDAPGSEISMITLNRLGLLEGTKTEFTAYKKTDFPSYEEPELLEFGSETVAVPGSLDVVVMTKYGEAFSKAVGIA